MADRIGVIDEGRRILVEDKMRLMQALGQKQLTPQLHMPLPQLPEALADRALDVGAV